MQIKQLNLIVILVHFIWTLLYMYIWKDENLEIDELAFKRNYPWHTCNCTRAVVCFLCSGSSYWVEKHSFLHGRNVLCFFRYGLASIGKGSKRENEVRMKVHWVTRGLIVAALITGAMDILSPLAEGESIIWNDVYISFLTFGLGCLLWSWLAHLYEKKKKDKSTSQ